MHHAEDDWLTCTWKLHVAVRDFFGPEGSFETFDDYLRDMKAGKQLNRGECPRQLFPPSPAITLPRSGNVSELVRGGGGNGPSKKQKKADGDRVSWAVHFAGHFGRAKEALESVKKGSSLKAFFPGNHGVRDALGPEFCRLLDGPGSPCGKKFLDGECKFSGCKFCHHLKSEPSEAVLRDIEKRVKARCDQIVANPSKG